MDTAHTIGSGLYDMGKMTHVHQFFQDVGNIFGKDKLRVIHLNDSEVPFGARKDRHEELTKGYIFGKDGGEQALKEFVKICGELSIPMISETSNPHADIVVIKGLL